jgi:hypothetical protein
MRTCMVDAHTRWVFGCWYSGGRCCVLLHQHAVASNDRHTCSTVSSTARGFRTLTKQTYTHAQHPHTWTLMTTRSRTYTNAEQEQYTYTQEQAHALTNDQTNIRQQVAMHRRLHTQKHAGTRTVHDSLQTNHITIEPCFVERECLQCVCRLKIDDSPAKQGERCHSAV